MSNYTRSVRGHTHPDELYSLPTECDDQAFVNTGCVITLPLMQQHDNYSLVMDILWGYNFEFVRFT